ncbi:hypothetical protein L7F22_026579 [Adiantum nelumboides]|nr:hypothetical protein [Adiantum nelumboides]
MCCSLRPQHRKLPCFLFCLLQRGLKRRHLTPSLFVAIHPMYSLARSRFSRRALCIADLFLGARAALAMANDACTHIDIRTTRQSRVTFFRIDELSHTMVEMRHHGWELPYHPLQIVAVAGFLALGFAFYIFFLPFVEYSILQTGGLVAYSLTILVVCTLYTWCVTSNLAIVQLTSLKKHGLPGNSFEMVSLEPQTQPQAQRLSFRFWQCPKINLCSVDTCRQISNAQDLLPENGNLFCSLCNVQVSFRTKHCRVCDKCIDGFDHHCLWLNNCIGKRNYKAFVILIVAALIMFTLQWSFGLWIIVQHSLRKRHYESIVSRKLGRSFPPLGYLLVLVSCTVLAMVATCVLAKLIFFHALLIKKGLTTYEYSLAKRNEEWDAEKKHQPKSLLLPGSTPDGAARNQQQQSVGAMSIDAEQLGESFSEKDLSDSWRALSQRFTTRKASVKINPWNLSLGYEGEDALQDLTSMPKLSAGHPVAPAKVLKSSFDSSQGFSAELEASYEMGSASRRFSGGHSGHIDEILCPWQNGKLPVDSFEQLGSSENDSGTLSHPVVKDNTLAPLQREARSVFKSSHSFCSGVSVSTPGAV